MDNTKKTIWITGGSRGIGLAIAKKLSSEGHQIIISGRSPAAEYIAAGKFDYEWLDYKNVHYYPYDVSNPQAIDFVLTNIRKQVGQVDILINNAGVFTSNSIEEYSTEKLREVFAINTFGAIDTMTSFLNEESEKPKTVINILSVAALKDFVGGGIYSSSKAAVAAYSKSVRAEVRSKGHHIINIYPGAVSTEIWPSDIRKEKEQDMMSGESVAQAVSGVINTINSGNITVEEMVLRPIGGDLS